MNETKLAERTPFLVVLSRKESVWVDTLQSAADVVQKYIAAANIGATEFYSCTKAGKVYSADYVVACVSYNGRIWDKTGKIALCEKEAIRG